MLYIMLKSKYQYQYNETSDFNKNILFYSWFLIFYRKHISNIR